MLLLISSLTIAQQAHRQYISLSFGPSFPVGDFSKTNINDSTSGWAQTGVAININYSYRLAHNFGIFVTGIFNSNGFDDNAYKSALEEANPEYNFAVESYRNWSRGGIFIGPFIRVPLSKRISWDLIGSFGFYSSYSPKITVLAVFKEDNSDQAAFYKDDGSAINYAYSIETGFKYKLSKYYLLLFADYLDSSHFFNNYSGWDINQESFQETFNQNISSVNLTIGLGYFIKYLI